MHDAKQFADDPHNIEDQPAKHKPVNRKRRWFFKIVPIVALLAAILLALTHELYVDSPQHSASIQFFQSAAQQNLDLTVAPAPTYGITPTKPVGRSTTSTPMTSYHVQGKFILDNLGRQYIPYGVQSTALFEPDWQNSTDYKNFTLAQMQAARTIWHSNVITFQISWANLFPDPNNLAAPDPAYLQAMDTAVTWANQEQMNVIFNLQDEASTNEIMATTPSITFWQVVAQRYKDNQRVFFDVFNEPRNFYDWNLWQSGGTFNGVQYVGMQQLVDTIRATGAQNLIMVQGQGAGESFDYANFQYHLLRGTNIVYAIHPYLSPTQHLTQQDWEQWWGQSVTNLNVPFMIGEWNETPGSGCVSNAASVVPLFLKYVQQLGIGLIAWALTPGSLIRATSNPDAAWDWSKPTQFDQGTAQVCMDTLNYPDYAVRAQGAGQLVMQFLALNDG
jgi:Cellulase (glycosyl hydrolase family 5)